MEIQTKNANLLNKALTESGDTIYTFVASTNEVDRDDEIVVTEGIQLENFLKNPVFLAMHQTYRWPIGKVVKTYTDFISKGDVIVTRLLIDVVIDDDEDGQIIKAKIDSGSLNAVSIGFRVLERMSVEGSNVTKFTKTELFEVSVVTLPANPSAVRIKAMDLNNPEISNLEKRIKELEVKLENNQVEKIGASISRANKTKLKQIHNLVETMHLDMKNVKDSLMDLIGAFEYEDSPDEEPEDKSTQTEKEKTNNVDITNKEQLLQIILG